MGLKVTPIFIMGVNRNGTTLLANTIIQHFPVAALHHPLHFGYFESNLYSNAQVYGEFQTVNDYLRFLGEYSLSDGFQIADATVADFLDRPYNDFFDFFFELHERLCQKHGYSHFLIKLDPAAFSSHGNISILLNAVKRSYDNAHFICVQREFNDYLSSQLFMNNQQYKTGIDNFRKSLKKLTATAYYYFFYSNMKKLLSSRNGFYLKFEDLIEKKQKTINEIGTFLEIKPKRKEIQFARNTSFQSKNSERKKEKASFFKWIFSSIPQLGQAILWIRGIKTGQRPILWYRLLKADHYPQTIQEELKEKGYDELVELLAKQKQS
jgi:hypothetical protein